MIPDPRFKPGDQVRIKPGSPGEIVGLEWSPPQGCYFYKIQGDDWYSQNVREYELRHLDKRQVHVPPVKHLRKVRARLRRAEEAYDPGTMRAGRKFAPSIQERTKLANELDLLFDNINTILDDLIGFTEDEDQSL